MNIQQSDPDSPQALACLAAYFDELALRIPGFTRASVLLPDPNAAQYRPPQGCFLIASTDRPVACVSLRRVDATTAEVKRLWVAADARGQGVSRRMMQAVEDAARALGYTALKLDTNSALTEALALYHRTGWTPVNPYSDWPADTWLGKPL